MRRAVVFQWWKCFIEIEKWTWKMNLIAAGLAQHVFHYPPEACGKWSAACFWEVSGAL
jgi:hypothetical protein